MDAQRFRFYPSEKPVTRWLTLVGVVTILSGVTPEKVSPHNLRKPRSGKEAQHLVLEPAVISFEQQGISLIGEENVLLVTRFNWREEGQEVLFFR